MAATATPAQIAGELKSLAAELGFAAAGVAAAVEPTGFSKLVEWLDRGFAGEMHYFDTYRDVYAHPKGLMHDARTVFVLAYPYRTTAPAEAAPGQGRIARYAWGGDYHLLLRSKLKILGKRLKERVRGGRCRGVVDTAPLLEREFAQLAGLGWIGKNTLLLAPKAGSWFFLCAMITNLDLPLDGPFESSHCGTCTACLDACPTQAFVEPFVLDARRCISYLTIEHRGPIDPELRSGMGDWVLGCDVCQDVCPWNRMAPATSEPTLQARPGSDPLALAPLFDLSESQFAARFAETPLLRPGRRGMLRNAAIALGNQRRLEHVAPLEKGLHDEDAVVRGAAAWALGEVGAANKRLSEASNAIRTTLHARAAIEIEPLVQEEITGALARIDAAE